MHPLLARIHTKNAKIVQTTKQLSYWGTPGRKNISSYSFFPIPSLLSSGKLFWAKVDNGVYLYLSPEIVLISSSFLATLAPIFRETLVNPLKEHGKNGIMTFKSEDFFVSQIVFLAFLVLTFLSLDLTQLFSAISHRIFFFFTLSSLRSAKNCKKIIWKYFKLLQFLEELLSFPTKKINKTITRTVNFYF